MSEHTTIVGMGPAGLGILIAAERQGRLQQLAANGLSLIEARKTPNELASSYFPWAIRSNSPGRQFIEALDSTGDVFRPILDTGAARKIHSLGNQIIPLALVQELLEHILLRVLIFSEREENVEVRFGANAKEIRRDNSFEWTIDDGTDRPSKSGTVVLAIGSQERKFEPNADVPVVLSTKLLAGDLSVVEEAVSAGRRIVIIGGSHSGFAAALKVLENFAPRLSRKQIKIVAKEKVQVYWEDAHQAVRAKYPIQQVDCDVESGEVNRFTGLRGDMKSLYERITNRQEPLLEVGNKFDIQEEECGVVISAIGYRTRSLNLVDQNGISIDLRRNRGHPEISSTGQLITSEGNALERIYGIGIGFPKLNELRRPRVGFNIFLGENADAILTHLLHNNCPQSANQITQNRSISGEK